jgi:hypothetical protein
VSGVCTVPEFRVEFCILKFCPISGRFRLGR